MIFSLKELIDLSENHRQKYNYFYNGRNGVVLEYWKGRRDEAGYFRDVFIRMIEEIELPQSRLDTLQSYYD